MGQLGFFDADKRLAALSAKGDPLEAIDRLVPWESFRSDIAASARDGHELTAILQATKRQASASTPSISRLSRRPAPCSTKSPATRKASVAPRVGPVRFRTLINASDMQSGDRLFEAGWLEDAMHVYNRRLNHCVAMIAAGRVNNQILEDNGALPRNFSEIAFAFLLRGEPAKGLATTGQWLLAVPSELHPVLAVRRAHVLAFLGRDEEAREIYRSYRGQLVERGLTVERLMADDLALLESAGQTLPPALRDEFQRDG